jgi:predicted nucleic acid-binding protein
MAHSIFTDTSAWYAYIDKGDADHVSAVNIVQTLSGPLITSNYIFDEILTLAKMRLGPDIAAVFGEKLWNQEITSLVRVTDRDETEAWNIFLKYKDKGFSFTDCTSFALMERLGISTAFAFDRHFSQYGQFVVIPST